MRLFGRRGSTGTEYMLVLSVVAVSVTAAGYQFVPTFHDGVGGLASDVHQMLATHDLTGSGGIAGGGAASTSPGATVASAASNSATDTGAGSPIAGGSGDGDIVMSMGGPRCLGPCVTVNVNGKRVLADQTCGEYQLAMITGQTLTDVTTAVVKSNDQVGDGMMTLPQMKSYLDSKGVPSALEHDTTLSSLQQELASGNTVVALININIDYKPTAQKYTANDPGHYVQVVGISTHADGQQYVTLKDGINGTYTVPASQFEAGFNADGGQALVASPAQSSNVASSP